MATYSFKKSERIKSEKVIEGLFGKSNPSNNSFLCYPLKVVFQKAEDVNKTNQVLISVSKRKFKHAVDRNRIKRQIREAYRLNKAQLSTNSFQIAFIFVANEHLEYKIIEKGMRKSLNNLSKLATSTEHQ